MGPKAIFLDRDGVLVNNSEHYYIWRTDQSVLVDGVLNNLKMLFQKGFQLFIVSNQGGISRDLYTKNDVCRFHAELLQTFRAGGVEVKDIAFCPHHPEIEKCLCRKPDSLMIEKLIAKYKIEKDISFFIGDSASDMEAASKAGIQGIRIGPNRNMYPYISFLVK